MYEVQQIYEVAHPPLCGWAQHLRTLLRQELPMPYLPGEILF